MGITWSEGRSKEGQDRVVSEEHAGKTLVLDDRNPQRKGIINGDETRVNQHDPEKKQQSSVWMFLAESPTIKFKRTSTGKQMVATFFRQCGHIATVPLQERLTESAEWYIHQCPLEVFKAWSKPHPKKKHLHKFKLYYDNASANNATDTVDFLFERGVWVIQHHPQYSPQLASCDWLLLLDIKKLLQGPSLKVLNALSKLSWGL